MGEGNYIKDDIVLAIVKLFHGSRRPWQNLWTEASEMTRIQKSNLFPLLDSCIVHAAFAGKDGGAETHRWVLLPKAHGRLVECSSAVAHVVDQAWNTNTGNSPARVPLDGWDVPECHWMGGRGYKTVRQIQYPLRVLRQTFSEFNNKQNSRIKAAKRRRAVALEEESVGEEEGGGAHKRQKLPSVNTIHDNTLEGQLVEERGPVLVCSPLLRCTKCERDREKYAFFYFKGWEGTKMCRECLAADVLSERQSRTRTASNTYLELAKSECMEKLT